MGSGERGTSAASVSSYLNWTPEEEERDISGGREGHQRKVSVVAYSLSVTWQLLQTLAIPTAS